VTTAILIFTDGRKDYLEETIASLRQAWGDQPVDEVVIINDSSSAKYQYWLRQEYPGDRQIHHQGRRGFAGAIQSGWDAVIGHDWIFHLEDDFIFNEPLNLEGMKTVLRERPDIVQMALKRQPWNDLEREAGGFMERFPSAYTNEITDGYRWCWQQIFFTTNPSLYRGSLMERGWPQESESEGKFGLRLMKANPDVKFGFWGHKADPPRVHHIGAERVGKGY
jgi:glycosyltransferase involved in cell wall biosynthesis